MMCMVKADAYGHGLVPVAEACALRRSLRLGVATCRGGRASAPRRYRAAHTLRGCLL